MMRLETLSKYKEKDTLIDNAINFLNSKNLIVVQECALHQKALYNRKYYMALKSKNIDSLRDKLNHLDVVAVYKQYKECSNGNIERRIIIVFIYKSVAYQHKQEKFINFFNKELYNLFDIAYSNCE